MVQRRPAQDTPSTLDLHEAEARYVGATATFGDQAAWRDGRSCDNWGLERLPELPPFDPAVQDLIEERNALGWYRLHCGGMEIDELFIVSPDLILSRSGSGASWLVWHRSTDAK